MGQPRTDGVSVAARAASKSRSRKWVRINSTLARRVFGSSRPMIALGKPVNFQGVEIYGATRAAAMLVGLI